MKKLAISTLIMFVLTSLSAQVQLETFSVIKGENVKRNYQVIYGMVQNHNRINSYLVPNELNKPNSPHDNLVQSGSNTTKDVYKYSRIAIRFYSIEDSSLVKLGEMGLKSIKLKVGNKSPIDIGITETDKLIHDKYINLVKVLEVKDENGNQKYLFNHNDIVEVMLEFEENDEKSIVVPSFNGKFKNTKSPYSGLNSNTGGFWVPMLLFSSNLKSDSTGIPFAAMPIGLAWGYKKYLKSGGYIGGSLMGNWLIYSEGKVNNDFTSSTNFSVSNISLGALVDFNDVIYLGYSYGFDFREGATDPGHMLVLGFGSGAIKFLKSNKGK